MAYNISPAFAALGITAFDSKTSLSTPSLTSPITSHVTPLTAPTLNPAKATSETSFKCTTEPVSEEQSSHQSTEPQKVILYSAPKPMECPSYAKPAKPKPKENDEVVSWFRLSLFASVACVAILYFHKPLLLHGWQFGYYGAILGISNATMIATGIIIIRLKLKSRKQNNS